MLNVQTVQILYFIAGTNSTLKQLPAGYFTENRVIWVCICIIFEENASIPKDIGIITSLQNSSKNTYPIKISISGVPSLSPIQSIIFGGIELQSLLPLALCKPSTDKKQFELDRWMYEIFVIVITKQNRFRQSHSFHITIILSIRAYVYFHVHPFPGTSNDTTPTPSHFNETWLSKVDSFKKVKKSLHKHKA